MKICQVHVPKLKEVWVVDRFVAKKTVKLIEIVLCFHKVKHEMEKKAERRTRTWKWIGLGLMGAQFGFMARLTWWEYSWDVMEPVTYFVGYATLIAMFAYYVITRQVWRWL